MFRKNYESFCTKTESAPGEAECLKGNQARPNSILTVTKLKVVYVNTASKITIILKTN